MSKREDHLKNKFKKNVYLKPDEYLNGWAKKCGWKATLVYDSLWRHANKDGISFPSIKLMAEEHGVSDSSIRRGLKSLIKYNLVRKKRKRNKSGKFLHNVYTLTEKEEWKSKPAFTQNDGSSSVHTDKNQRSQGTHKGTHKKGTHIPPIESPLKKNKKQKIQQITKEDMEAIAEKYSVPLAFVMSKYDDLINYCERTGKKYKNYVAALRNFVKQDAIKLRKEAKGEPTKRAIDASNL